MKKKDFEKFFSKTIEEMVAEQKKTQKLRVVTFRFGEKDYEYLKRIAFENNVPISFMLDF
jgi:hypothetical protein